jgi:hypothetical protein
MVLSLQLCQTMAPPLLLSFLQIMLLGGGNSLYSNLTYIICNAIMLECVAHFYLDLHHIKTYFNYCSDYTESKILNFSYNMMDRSHTLKHIMFIQ